MTSIVWFRQDLRLTDNPALASAANGEVLPVYILDESESVRRIGGASRWWLHHSLKSLSADLPGLVLLRGDPHRRLIDLVGQSGATSVVWNRCYDPGSIARDKVIKADLKRRGIDVRTFNASLLHEPWQVQTGSGGPYRVFTPFWRACLARDVDAPLPRPEIGTVPTNGLGEDLQDWALPPTRPDWAAGWEQLWRPGEAGAADRLEIFVERGLDGYAINRNRPDLANVSRLSPHLHFGEISPRQIWAKVQFSGGRSRGLPRDVDTFVSELGWREFSHHLLYHFPDLPSENWKRAFDAYPWRDSRTDLEAWQRGATGYPLVDAGMRELWQTGYMHNRVRMVAASFLVKHLRIHWREGEAWFWDTLNDADVANNAAGWQWVAGSGADAAPYFRIFNPVAQGEKFDPSGSYVRKWCPELTNLDAKYIHKPFETPQNVLNKAGIELGITYPLPIVDHAEARRAALAGYEAVRAAG